MVLVLNSPMHSDSMCCNCGFILSDECYNRGYVRFSLCMMEGTVLLTLPYGYAFCSAINDCSAFFLHSFEFYSQ